MLPKSEHGITQILLLIAGVGLLSFFALVSFAPFKNQLFSSLFPKNSSFAAYLFTDDFENGLQVSATDLNKWQNLWQEGASGQPKTATLTLEPAAALHGANGIHIKHIPDINNFIHDEARLDKNLSPIDDVYARFRLKLVSDFVGGTNRYLFALADTSAGYASGMAFLVHSPSTTSKNRLKMYFNASLKDTGVNLTPGVAYCVEIHLKRHDTAGQVQVWLNGAQTPIYEANGVNTGISPITWLRFGSDGGDNSVTGGGVQSDYYLDDLALNSTNRLNCGELPTSFGPERSQAQPVGSLPTGTTAVNISLNTDVAATCKYSTTTGLDFNSIPNTFTSTGGTTHSQNISGISPGTNYNYFVRCKDNQSGIVNPDDYPITFRMGINDLVTKDLTLIPTYQSISVYAPYAQDENANAQATLEWRKAGDPNWKKGMALTDDRRASVTANNNAYPNPVQFVRRASVIGLQSNTDYEIKVSYQDPDGIVGPTTKSASIRTKNDNFSLGTGKQYFVSPTGNDISSTTDPTAGSITKPFKTIQFAANLLAAGDSILIRAGTYSEAVYINTKSGTETNRITIKNYNNEKVILNGANSLKNAFVVYKSNFIVISGFEIKDYADTNLLAIQGGGGAIRIHSSKNIVVDGNDIYGYIWNAIRVQNGSIITIQNNKINRTRDIDAATGNGHGIAIYDNDTTVVNDGQFVIRNNALIDSSGVVATTSHYWDTIGGGSNWDIEGFVSRDSDIYRNSITGCTDDGIEADGGLINVRIYENYIWSNGKCVVGISSAPAIVGPFYVFRNLFDGEFNYVFKEGRNSAGTKYYYHNTLYNPGSNPKGNDFSMSNAGHRNNTSRNNILQAGRYIVEWEKGTLEEAKTHNYDYDSLYTTGVGYFVKWQSSTATEKLLTFEAFKQNTGQESHGLSIDNRNEFKDLLNKDFRLKDTSQLKDRGQILYGFNDPDSAWPYQGSAPDIGAYEVGATYGPQVTVQTQTPAPSSATPTPSVGIKVGDIVGNNKVDIFDYNALLTDFGKKNDPVTPADLDDDNDVDIFDYNILLTNFGH